MDNETQETTALAATPIDGPLVLLNKAFSLYWAKLSIILPLAFVVFIVALLQVFSTQINSAPLGIVSALAGMLVSYIVYLAMIRVVSGPTTMHVGEALVSVERFITPALWVSGFLVLIVLGGTVLAIVPGIIVAIYGTFAVFAVMVDQYQKKEAVLFSWHLVRGRWWRVVLRLVVANLVIACVVGVVMMLFWAFGAGETPTQTVLRAKEGIEKTPVSQQILTQTVSTFFTMPLTICFMFVFYEALKRTSGKVPSHEERVEVQWYMRMLSIVGVAFLISSIFVSGYFISRFLPPLVQATHMPAAVFSIF